MNDVKIADDLTIAYQDGYRDGLWDMFIRLSNSYHGKQYYFLQDNGMVYSRESGQYMILEEAIEELQRRLDNG